jgi:hypothetical protein
MYTEIAPDVVILQKRFQHVYIGPTWFCTVFYNRIYYRTHFCVPKGSSFTQTALQAHLPYTDCFSIVYSIAFCNQGANKRYNSLNIALQKSPPLGIFFCVLFTIFVLLT